MQYNNKITQKLLTSVMFALSLHDLLMKLALRIR